MQVITTILRLLTFKLSREEMLGFNRSHFIAGLLGTWVVGMGRYWDATDAETLQYLGVGSVVYIFVLAAFIWIVLLPFKLEKWSYFLVLTFISLTSFPAIFYAIPVERFWSVVIANEINVWFLAIVASWRLALLFFFIRKFTRLSWIDVIAVCLLPVCLIISMLAALNLHKVVFNIMSSGTPNAHAGSQMILFLLTALSAVLVIPLLFIYCVAIYFHRKKLLNKSD